MHIILCFLAIAAVWYKGIWREWKMYHASMLFFSLMELQYNLIVSANNHFLWKILPDMGMNRVSTVSLYVVITFPLTTLLFLSKDTSNAKESAIQIGKWVLIYSIIEAIASLINRIAYYNGWSLWQSIIFDVILFWGLKLHYKRPIIAYIIFALVAIWGIWAYEIPL